MRVKVKTTAAGPFGCILAGHEGEVPDNIGAAMIKAGSAVRVGTAKPEKKVEPVIETATAEPVEMAMKPPARRRQSATVSKS